MAEEAKPKVAEKKPVAPAGPAVLVLAGVIVGLLFVSAGLNMIGLRSQAGNTVAEAYYQASGWACLGLGLFCASVLWTLSWLVGKK